jgi:hypothetical protein
MPTAQGINKVLAYKKQTALGTSASGAGGQRLRRETATFSKVKETYSADEIVSHQQDTGDTYGPSHTTGEINGVLSAGTYSALLGSLLRADFGAVSASTGLSLTIGGSGPYTLTRSAGSFLTDGIKIGMVVRITAGTYTGTARDVNLIVTNVTATVLTVIVANGKSLTAQGPVASSTVTVIGKKSTVPSSGHTNDYYSFEEWFSDITKSRLWTDTQIGSADISIPATGNATIKLAALGLGRTKGNSQVLTSPTAETTTTILSAANAKILIAGSVSLVGTSLQLKIDGQLQTGEATISSNTISDNYRGDIKATGTVTTLKQDETFSDLFDNETPTAIIGILFADQSDTSDFVGFTVPRVKLFSDEVDDGKKQLIATHTFTGEYNGASGGSGVANDSGIVTIQDSAA